VAPGRCLHAVIRSGSGRRGGALVPGEGDCLPLGEHGAGEERLIERNAAELVADSGHQLALYRPQVGPRRQANPPAQALGRAFQQRRPGRVVVC